MTAADNIPSRAAPGTGSDPVPDPAQTRAALEALAAEARVHAEEARADLERLSTMLTAEPTAQAENLAASRRLAAAEQTVADVAESLERLDAGTYGICARCADPIPAGRLEMRPHSRYCVSCT